MATIAVSGATGLVGQGLQAALRLRGVRICRLVRPSSVGDRLPDDIPWDPGAGTIEAARLEDVDGVVHLAGESIAGGRWSAARKRRILESRTQSTRLLAEAIAGLSRPPPVLVSASAVGFYGACGAKAVDDFAPPGEGFLADVAQAWEGAAEPARKAGVRVVHPRFGVVLDPAGGALAKLLPVFRLGLGGRLGDGRQLMSWIALEDAANAVLHLLDRDDLHGGVNVTAPFPLSNADFTRALSKAISRPAMLPVPAFALRAAVGQLADEALLSGVGALPQRLNETGFRFSWPRVEPFLRHVL